MTRRSMLSSVVTIAMMLFVVEGCGGGGSSPPATATNAGATPSSTTSKTPGANPFDVTFTGAIEGHLQSGDAGAAVSCVQYGSDLETAISGSIGGTPYLLATGQDTFTPGTYSYPAATGSGATPPRAQITNATDSSARWNLLPNRGSGSVSLNGGNGSPLDGMIDANFVAAQDSPIHVKATFTCEILIRRAG